MSFLIPLRAWERTQNLPTKGGKAKRCFQSYHEGCLLWLPKDMGLQNDVREFLITLTNQQRHCISLKVLYERPSFHWISVNTILSMYHFRTMTRMDLVQVSVTQNMLSQTPTHLSTDSTKKIVYIYCQFTQRNNLFSRINQKFLALAQYCTWGFSSWRQLNQIFITTNDKKPVLTCMLYLDGVAGQSPTSSVILTCTEIGTKSYTI